MSLWRGDEETSMNSVIEEGVREGLVVPMPPKGGLVEDATLHPGSTPRARGRRARWGLRDFRLPGSTSTLSGVPGRNVTVHLRMLWLFCPELHVL